MSSFIPVQPQSAMSSHSPFTSQWLEHVAADLDVATQKKLYTAAQHVESLIHGLCTPTGEPLDAHTAAVLGILKELNADAPTRLCAILAAVEPKDQFSHQWLKNEYGEQVATMVKGTRALYDLGVLAAQAQDDGAATGSDQKEMKRKMLLAMAVDLRIVLVRLASRLQSLRWFVHSKTQCSADYAKETMELYTPLANRLGIWQLKWEMEDLAFRFLQPQTYKQIAKKLEEKRAEREQFIKQVVQRLTDALNDMQIQAEVSGRPKHIYSIYNKMHNKNLRFEQLYDIRALRVIVEDERSCYGALALIHSMWTPIADEFDDYISRPKPNGYRSLHTVVADDQGRTFEVQIRTHDMHHFAEFGMAAHWHYKESGAKGGQVSASPAQQKIAWMRQLLAWDQPQTEAAAFVESTPEHIYVLTPQARVIELPYGATPVDFAYYLHTDLGHRCRGAKVDGQMVPLLTQLQTGQTVEIIAAKSGGPSRDWLNPQLGFLASPRSRAKVRAWFNAIELQQRISQGQAMVEKELQRLGRTAVNLEQLAHKLGFAQADDLYVAVAKDEFSLRQIDAQFKTTTEDKTTEHTPAFHTRASNVTRTGKSGVLVVGVDALMTQLARCCRPAPPDAIGGYITKGRGVSIHRSDCKSYLGLVAAQPERAIEVEWGQTEQTLYPIDLMVSASESPHLLRDISEVFARLRVNVMGVNTQSRRSLTRLLFTLEVADGEQIQRIISALEALPGVEAKRY